jgi:hypothetical protein
MIESGGRARRLLKKSLTMTWSNPNENKPVSDDERWQPAVAFPPEMRQPIHRHGRARPGHPRLSLSKQDVDARHKAGHDEEWIHWKNG